MLGFGKAMVDVGMGAGVYESVSSEGFLARDQLLDLGRCPIRATGIGEVQAVVGQHGMDLVGNSGDQVEEELSRDGSGGLLVQLCEGEL
jgi:hypothetical protein